MLKLLALALFATATHAAAGLLPEKTVSEVCPALTYNYKVQGSTIYFLPDAYDNFKFVDLHISRDGEGVINYSMKQSTWNGQFAYEVSVDDDAISSALQANNAGAGVVFSFTYCVGINGKPVDCDTDTIPFEPCDWHADAFPVCPRACGLQTSTIYREVHCKVLGSGVMKSAEWCSPDSKPATEQRCPATEECEEFNWRAGQIECPTTCGLPASILQVPAECVGNQGSIGTGPECGPRPADVECPSTPACVTYKWNPLPVDCPKECGLEASQILPEVSCLGSDGISYPHSNCANLPMPEKIRCPATHPCVTFSWEAQNVVCPTSCGLPPSKIRPLAICLGSDDLLYPDVHCKSLPYPDEIVCDATPACVTYNWEAESVQCPDECGLEPSVIRPEVICRGSDGKLYPSTKCHDMRRPEIQCAATKPCPRPLPYCPSITFRQTVQYAPGKLEFFFVPTNPGAKRMRFDFVDLHVQFKGGNLLNNRMKVAKSNLRVGQKEGIEFSWVVEEEEVYEFLRNSPNTPIEYSFTYCIERTDCDTALFYFSPFEF